MMMKILQDVHSLLLDDRICSLTTPPRIVGGVGIRTGWMDRWVDVRCFISKLVVTDGKEDIRHSILVLISGWPLIVPKFPALNYFI